MSEIKIGFTGDFCPIGRISNIHDIDVNDVLGEVKEYFWQNDLNVIDLECPLTDSTKAIEKTGPHLKATPEAVIILTELNCKLVVTANNHFKDFGKVGLEDTYKVLTENNINWVGSGLDLNEAKNEFVFNKNDVSVSIYNICENEWSVAGTNSAGCNGMDTIKDAKKINQLSKIYDHLIVVIHGGHENYPLPSPRMKELYRFYVDCGASAVISHHTHIISGFEKYKDAIIFYGLGNFCFDWPGNRSSPWNYGMLVTLSITKEKVDYEYRLIEQMNSKPRIKWLKGENNQREISKINELNEIIVNDKLLSNEFEKYIKEIYKLRLTRLQPYRGKYLPALYKRKLLPSLITKEKAKLYQNFFRCESHREVMEHVLNKFIK